MSRFLAIGIALVTFIAFAGMASAQYPEPENNLTPQGPTTSTQGGVIEITCTLRDASGAPVSNELVAFEITDNPGDAQLQKTSGVTDANGQVQVPLFVGTAAGNVEVTCSNGSIEATYVAQVLGAQITPPATGDAGLAAPGRDLAPMALAGLALSLGAIALTRRPSSSC